MTVKDLVKMLLDYNQDASVIVINRYNEIEKNMELGYGAKKGDEKNLSDLVILKSLTPIEEKKDEESGSK